MDKVLACRLSEKWLAEWRNVLKYCELAHVPTIQNLRLCIDPYIFAFAHPPHPSAESRISMTQFPEKLFFQLFSGDSDSFPMFPL